MSALDRAGCYAVKPGTCSSLDCAPPCNNTEYTLCLDSTNRNTEQFPEPNDFPLELKSSPSKLSTCLMSMGSIELPLAQNNIECLWNRIYFDEGFRAEVDITATSSAVTPTLAIRQFDISDPDVAGGVPQTVCIPAYLNPIVQIAVAGPVVTFTTFFEHCLGATGGVASQWLAWNDPIRLVTLNTPSSTDDIVSGNTSLVVTGPNTFSLTYALPPAALGPVVFPPANLGFLYAPTIQTPSQLAAVVNAAISETLLAGIIRLDYNTFTNEFTFSRTRGFPVNQGETTLINAAGYSLLSRLGFRIGVTVFSSTVKRTHCQPSFQNQRLPTTIGPYQAVGNQTSCDPWVGYVQLDCCTYAAGDLATEIKFEFNRMYVECACLENAVLIPPVPTTNNAGTFVFSNQCGVCCQVDVPCGMYSPDFMAQFLENAMNTATCTTPALVQYTVIYVAETEQFVFSASHPTTGVPVIFGLEFGISGELLHSRLGFEAKCYRGQSSYTSPMPVHVPSTGCGLSSRQSRWIYNWSQNECGNRFELATCKVPCIGDTTGLNSITVVGATVEVEVDHPTGWLECDMVTMYVASTGATHTFHVISAVFNTGAVPSWTYTLDNGGGVVFPPAPVPIADYCFCTEGEPVFNVYFYEMQQGLRCKNYATQPLPRSIIPTLIGFEVGTYEYASEPHPDYGPDYVSNTLVSPNHHSVRYPNYLLVLLKDVNGSDYVQHRWKEDNIGDLFAKIVLYPDFRLERLYAMRFNAAGNESIGKVHFCILNPDHTLYNFHGRNWSMTLSVATAEKQGRAVCF
jgi:hypothetical protein